MRIVHFTSVHPIYDTRIMVKECRTLRECGHDVRLLAAHDKSEIVDGIQVIGVGTNKGNRLIRMTVTTYKLFRECLRQKADIYHFHDPELMPVGLLLKLIRKCVIYDVHEDVPRDIFSKKWIPLCLKKPVSYCIEKVEQFVAKRLDAIVTSTPYIAQRFRTYNPNTYEIQNFPLLDELVGRRNGQPKEGNYIAYIGSISEVRGMKDMIESLEELNRTQPVTLLLGGYFSTPQLLEEVRQMPGWAYVDFRGRVNREQFREIMDQSKLGLVVLHPEPNFIMSQPNKLYEYMSAGVPVLASDFPLWKQIVEGNQCGLCIPPMLPHTMADAIQYILEHPEEAKRMGENGRRAAITHYNWQPEGRKLHELYERLIQQPPIKGGRDILMALFKKASLLLFTAILLSGIITTYLEQTEQSAIMPIRNLIYFGTLHAINYEEIAPVKYKDSEAGYNPVVIAQLVRMKALKVLEQDKAMSKSVLSQAETNKVLEVADYFLKNGEAREWKGIRYTVWSYQMDRPDYGLKKPWLSAMAQGHAIETMLASYRLTDKPIYLEMAKLAANALYVPIENGGVTRQVGEGVWFEEYASPQSAKQPYVLNGNIYTLYGLRYLTLEDNSYAELYKNGLLGLKTLLPQYDAGVWSRYDLAGSPANAFYQRVHVEQLEDLYNKTGDRIFLDYSRKFKWETYLPLGVFYRVVALPNIFLVLIMSLNTAVSLLILWIGHRLFVKKGRSRTRRNPAKRLTARNA